ncbi:MAG: histidinol-phosphatase [Lachnospiraceae bacterium]|nr:histidinol-phosphatase [Lachnospiraceae bacterium]
MKKVNFHTHTYRCKHASGTEADYIDKAYKLGFDRIGMSDHAPFMDQDYGLRMMYDEFDEYLEKIEECRIRYAGRMEVYKSIEIEYLPKYESYYEFLLNDKKLDYLILGEHFYMPDDNGVYPNIFNPKCSDTYPDYAKGIKDGLDSGFFTYVAHPDLFTLGDFAWDKNFDMAADIILDAAVKHNAILEINANGFRRGIKEYPDGPRYMYPHRRFWEMVSKTELRVVVGADAHSPELLWDDAMDIAYKWLDELGITPYDHFE